jgi:hypothetical protein
MHELGQLLDCRGNFTLLRYVSGLCPEDLERTVGFHRGRLSSGFSVIALADSEVLEPDDFELKASTRWSGGTLRKSSTYGGAEISSLLEQRGQDVTVLKSKVCKHFSRRGGNTPAKVLPNARHTDDMLYPDAEALPGIRSGVPQFNLLHLKKFVVVRAA